RPENEEDVHVRVRTSLTAGFRTEQRGLGERRRHLVQDANDQVPCGGSLEGIERLFEGGRERQGLALDRGEHGAPPGLGTRRSIGIRIRKAPPLRGTPRRAS